MLAEQKKHLKYEGARGRKETKYQQRVLDVKMGSFTPVVFGLNGGRGSGCQRFLKYLADKIAQKDTALYNTVIAWLRTQISFEQLRSVHAYVRGSRTPLQSKNKTVLILQNNRRQCGHLDFLGNFQACLFFFFFFNKF